MTSFKCGVSLTNLKQQNSELLEVFKAVTDGDEEKLTHRVVKPFQLFRESPKSLKNSQYYRHFYRYRHNVDIDII